MGARALSHAEPNPVPGDDGPRLPPALLRPRALTSLFVLLSAGISLAILAVRNLYDDELLTLYLPVGHIRDILAIAAEGDVHPPGMYILGHLGWMLTHSYRWLNLVPLAMLYAGLAVFLIAIAPLCSTTRAQLCLLLLATLNPQLLLWSNTFRWYCPWTGLALIALTLALDPAREAPRISPLRAFLLGTLLAAMFYLNYITLLFAPLLFVATLVRDPRPVRWLKAESGAFAVFVLLILPQLRTMFTVHLPNGHAQQYEFTVSLARLAQSITQSEAFLPWQPLAVVAAISLLSLAALGARTAISSRRSRANGPAVQALMAFASAFFIALIISGLGGKPRNGLLLIPVFALVFASGLHTLHRHIQTSILLLLSLWSGTGMAHLLGRYDLLKAGMTDQPEQVVTYLARNRAETQSTSGPQCSVVVTYDSALAFSLAQSHLPRVSIISPFGGTLFGGSSAGLPLTCAQLRLYVVESYIAGSPDDVATYTAELHSAETLFTRRPEVARLDPDQSAPEKRRLAAAFRLSSGESLPDFRYIVNSGPIEPAAYPTLAGMLQHFYSLRNDPSENPPAAP